MMFIEAKRAAVSLGVSSRRVRALLSQGRIPGYKSDRTGRWMVVWPLDVLPGTRGPDLRHFPVRHVYAPAKPSKGAKQGRALPSKKKTPLRLVTDGSA